MEKIMLVNNVQYNIIRLLGHGKGGYSYLIENEGKYYVLKQIHHEPCDYYSFNNKIISEKNDYERLLKTGINIPKMIDIDIENERIIKEYIDGPTIYELIKNDSMKEEYIIKIKEIAKTVSSFGINIDYFPTNFIVQNGILFYIDYECNEYMNEWNFENWGVKYWSKTKEFIEYMNKNQKL